MYLGCDPGKKGSLAVIDQERFIIHHDPTPMLKLKKPDYDIVEMKLLLQTYQEYGVIDLCILEKAQAMPRQGVTSMFSIGKGYGIWLGLLTSLGIPFIEVHPRVWTRKLFIGVGGEGKDRNYNAARRLYPEWHPGYKYEREYADSLLLAEYGRLLWGKK
ncbi:MAG: hypothetical protein DRR06_19895 [Gammaproteobacteria bacterium]|nr:MAG: hypothetical protein DRR06_19895 [Gammaproteobacteria bacterium]